MARPKYALAEEVKEAFRESALASLSDDIVEDWIMGAEDMIDAYCGYHEFRNSDTGLIFPRPQDGGVILDAIREATIAQTEFMYQHQPDYEHGVKSEESRELQTISPRAKEYLRGFRKRTGGFAYPITL